VQINIGNDPNVFAFLRTVKSGTILVVLNMSVNPHKWGFKVEEYGIPTTATLLPLYNSVALDPGTLSPLKMQLPPFAAIVAKIQ